MTKKLFLFSFLFLGLIAPIFFVSAAGNTSGKAWSDQEGYIDFGCKNCNATVDNGSVSGYAWSNNFGWINLSPKNGGIENDGSGKLSGYAWSSAKGWLDFSGVTINSSGNFKGQAVGFNGNNESVNFECKNCDVKTTWTSQSVGSGPGAGGKGGAGGGLITMTNNNAPVGQLGVLINNGSLYTNSANVTLTLQAGADVKKMAVSNTPGFENISQENFQATKNWTLTSGDGQKTVYVKFYTESGQASAPVSASIALDTAAPSIKITNVKQTYNPADDVIIGGTTSKGNIKIIVSIGGESGTITSDANGQWLTTLGKFPVGNYYVEVTPKDLAGNTGITVSADFSIQNTAPLAEPQTQQSILDKIKNGLDFLSPQAPKTQEPKPVPVVTVPKVTPLALKHVWSIFPTDSASQFVLAPLPKDIALLTQKFPELTQTFKNVGVTKVSDVGKLKSTNLNLPGLSQAIGLRGTEISPGKFAPPSGIQVANLSAEMKEKIPTNTVFAKVGGGLVDLNAALSLNDKGQAEQKITTVVGKTLQLTVRVDKPAKNVIGYMVFKSKNPSANPSAYVSPINSFVSFLSSFITKDMTAYAKTEPSIEAKTISTDVNLKDGLSQPEKMLILSRFDYTDAGNDVYIADVQAPAVEGEYSVVTVVDYKDSNLLPKQMELITVVDPEGYVYEKNGDQETRIGGAVVSLYWLNPKTKKYEVWPANDYQQENPQVTDVRGTYSFLVPDGYYYLTVDAPGYLSYGGSAFQASGGSGVHINIEMKSKFWWAKVVDWKTILLIVVILLLLYNFYKDKIREKNILKKAV